MMHRLIFLFVFASGFAGMLHAVQMNPVAGQSGEEEIIKEAPIPSYKILSSKEGGDEGSEEFQMKCRKCRKPKLV